MIGPFKRIYLFLFYLYDRFTCMNACMCTMFTLGAHRDQKKASESLELDLWTGISCHVGAENRAAPML